MTALWFTRRRDEVEEQLRELLIARGVDPDDGRSNVVADDDDEELRSTLIAWQGATNQVRAFLGLYSQSPELPSTAAERQARADGDWETHDRLVMERHQKFQDQLNERMVAANASVHREGPHQLPMVNR